MHQHLIKFDEAFAGGHESISLFLFVPFPREQLGRGEAEKVTTGRVGDADGHGGNAVADLDVDVKSEDFVAAKFPDERHDETFGDEGRLVVAETGRKWMIVSECN